MIQDGTYHLHMYTRTSHILQQFSKASFIFVLLQDIHYNLDLKVVQINRKDLSFTLTSVQSTTSV